MVSLNADSLLNAAKRMSEAANQIDDSIVKIDNAMSNLNTVWRDDNSQKYLEKYTELKETVLPDFKRSVRDYSDFLVKVVEIYKKEFLEETSESVQ